MQQMNIYNFQVCYKPIGKPTHVGSLLTCDRWSKDPKTGTLECKFIAIIGIHQY